MSETIRNRCGVKENLLYRKFQKSGLGREGAMIDWVTLAIELVGIAILLMWVVVPIREFREIFRAVRRKTAATETMADREGPRR
jgi:hypothetical protein